MNRVLVTGATGFLGKSVVSAITNRGWLVTAHGRSASPFSPDVEFIRGNLDDAVVAKQLLSPWRWDAVVNLAGPVTGGTEDLSTGMDVVAAHARIALHVRQFAGTSRIVHASSMTVYGVPQRRPIDEAHSRRPSHLYGLAKVVAEDVLLTPGLDAWVLRLPGLFSEQRRGGALYHFCVAACRGTPLRVTTTSPTPWDVLHVDDATDAILAALGSSGNAPGAINIAYGDPVELVAIAELIALHAQKGSSVEHVDGVTHPVFQLDIAKARRLLDWSPPSLRDRLTRYYAAIIKEVA